MAFQTIHGDIVKMETDAIVNAANRELRAGGGVCGAIFAAAGFDRLQDACDEIGHVDTGDAVVTPGFDLKAKWIVHTAGPVWHGGKHREREKLESCYRRSLEVAYEAGAASIAFPLISSGIYGYPYDEALEVAQTTLSSSPLTQEMDIYLVLYP